ncbi:hypothetical protein, partial [Candidatus Pyrohabitans sp.]
MLGVASKKSVELVSEKAHGSPAPESTSESSPSSEEQKNILESYNSEDFCPLYGANVKRGAYGTGESRAEIRYETDPSGRIKKACLQHKGEEGWVGVVCGDLEKMDMVCCYDMEEAGYFWERNKICLAGEERGDFKKMDEESCNAMVRLGILGEKPKPEETKYGCEVVGFELPQKVEGGFKEYVLNTGDPKYLAYWQKWPQGEEAAWMGLLDWSENMFSIFMWAAAGAVAGGCGLKYVKEKEMSELNKLITKIEARLGKDTVRLVGKGKETIRDRGLKSADQIADAIGLKKITYKSASIGKNLVLTAGVGGYTVSQGAEFWLDSIAYKFEKEKGNTLILVNPGRKGYEFSLGENTKEYHVILERDWINEGDDVSFYLASPCKTDLQVVAYPVKVEGGKKKSKYTCGNALDKLTCGIKGDEPVWISSGRCIWDDEECMDEKDEISEQFKKCIDNNPGDDEEAIKARLSCFYNVVDNYAKKGTFTPKECGCFDYGRELKRYMKVKDVNKAVTEVCGEKPAESYFYVNDYEKDEDKRFKYCKELHGRYYPLAAERLNAIEIKATYPYPEYKENYCYATSSRSYKAFKLLDLGSTIFLGWNPAGACLKRSAFSLAGAAVFTKLS